MILRRFAALAVSLALLGGLPYVAVAVLEWPALDLSLTEVLARLRGGSLPPGLGSAVLIIALWAVWGLYLAALVAEASAWVRGRTSRWRPLGPLQVVAATAIGASLASPAAAHAATPAPAAVTDTPTTDPETSPQPQPTPMEPSDLPVSGKQVIERERVVDNFGYDSATLAAEMKDELAPVVSMIRTHAVPEEPIRVTGYTDAAGDAAYNQQLSQERAEAVADYLRAQLGQDAPAIEARGEGEAHLLDGAGAASQRRAEIAYTVTPQPPERPSDQPEASATEQESEEPPAADQPEHSQTPAPENNEAVIVVKLPGGVVLTSMAAGGVAAGFALGRRSRTFRSSSTETTTPATEAGRDHPAPAQPSPQAAPDDAADAPSDVDATTVLDLSAGGLGITGPGAHGAARSLLAAALSTDGDPPLHLVIPEEDAETLLGAEAAALLADRAPASAIVTPALSDALTRLHSELVARPGEDEDDAPIGSAEAQPPTPVLLIASPDQDHTAELRALLAQGRPTGIAALLLGRWPRATATVTADHTLTTTDTALGHLTGAHWPATDSGTLTRVIAALPARDRHRAELHVLGRITLATATGPMTLRRRAAFEVAAYLATHSDGPRLERAVEDMWPGEATHRANRRFHDAISALRSAAGDDQLILYENGRYRLNPAAVTVDLWELESRLTAAETDPGDARVHARIDRAAAGFADLAAEADYAWAEPVRLELRRRLIGALLACAASTTVDDPRPLLAQAVAIAPRHTDAQHALISAHLDHDDSTAALQAFRTYESAMGEIDAEPDATIRGMVKNIGIRA